MRHALVIASVLAVAASTTVSAPATAATEQGRSDRGIAVKLEDLDVERVVSELRQADLVRDEHETSGGISTTIALPDGMTFDIVSERGTSTERLSGGYDSGGSFVKFNQYDQNLLLNGAGLALGTAICLIPAVGQLACIAVQSIIAAASAAVSAMKGTCKNNKQLKVYFSNNHAKKNGCV